jgi:hypothetical protein
MNITERQTVPVWKQKNNTQHASFHVGPNLLKAEPVTTKISVQWAVLLPLNEAERGCVLDLPGAKVGHKDHGYNEQGGQGGDEEMEPLLQAPFCRLLNRSSHLFLIKWV